MKSKTFSLQSSLLILIIIGIVLLLNLIANEEYAKVDLTENNLYTLNSTSRAILKNLNDVCNVTVYLSRDMPTAHKNSERAVRDKLDNFKEIAGDNLHYRIIMVSEGDSLLKKEMASDGIRPVQVGEQTKTKVGVQLIYKSMKIDYQGKSQAVVIDEKTLEYDIMSALKGLSRDMRPKIGLLISIRDPKLEQQLKTEIEKQIDRVLPQLERKYPDIKKEDFKKQKLEEWEAQLPQEMKRRFLEEFAGTGVFMLLNQYFDIDVLDILDLRKYEWESIVRTIQQLRGGMNNPFQQTDKSQALAQMFGFPFKKIPDDIDVVLVYQPSSAIPEKSFELVNDFVMKGKSAFFLIDQTRPGQMYNTKFGLDRELNINDFLSKYGVVVKKDLIMDKSCVQNEVPILENFRLRTVPVSNLYQPIIREFPSNFPAVANFKGMVFDSVNPVDFSEAQKDNNIKITTLFTSSGQARVEEGNSMGAQGNMIPLPGVEDINKEKFDKSKIPFGIAMEGAFLNAYPGTMGTGSNASSSSQDTSVSQTSAKPDESKESVSGVRSKPARMIIVGDADFVSAGGGDNFNFLLNSIEWLARDPYILSDLRGREFAINLISEEMSESVQTWIEILNIVVTPLLVVILSLLAWFFRRNRKRRHEFA